MVCPAAPLNKSYHSFICSPPTAVKAGQTLEDERSVCAESELSFPDSAQNFFLILLFLFHAEVSNKGRRPRDSQESR